MCYWRISHHSISFFKSGIILRKALIVLDCFSVRIRQHHVQIGDTREVGFLQLCVEKGGTGRYLRTIKSVFWGVKCWNWCSWRKRSFSLKLALLNTHASSRLAHILAARLCWHSSGHIWCFCSVVQPNKQKKWWQARKQRDASLFLVSENQEYWHRDAGPGGTKTDSFPEVFHWYYICRWSILSFPGTSAPSLQGLHFVLCITRWGWVPAATIKLLKTPTAAEHQSGSMFKSLAWIPTFIRTGFHIKLHPRTGGFALLVTRNLLSVFARFLKSVIQFNFRILILTICCSRSGIFYFIVSVLWAGPLVQGFASPVRITADVRS